MCPRCKGECPKWITLMDDKFVCSECIKKTHSSEEIERIGNKVVEDFKRTMQMFVP